MRIKNVENTAKPFLKWAGGKTQLLNEIERSIPEKLKHSEFVYIEPFVGGGAVFFWIMQKYATNIKHAVINDVNTDLINTYLVVQSHVDKLIEVLRQFEKEFHSLEDHLDGKKEYFYEKRAKFNARKSDNIEQAALMIFLNKTCFNGLYRVNRKNEFNVPIGRYKRPLICDEPNLRAVSRILQNVTILNGDFEVTADYIDGDTLFYCDPPYRPLTKTASFNSYSYEIFDDSEQIRLARFCKNIDVDNVFWILSNSDPKAADEDDNFFDKLYEDYLIKRVYAKRFINSNSKKRGALTELIIANSNKLNKYHGEENSRRKAKEAYR